MGAPLGRTRPLAWAVLVLGFLAGCAAPGFQPEPMPAGLPARAEIEGVPFFPDDSHYCGPAALATSLSAAGLETSPEDLVGQVFLPGRQGSLQIEMLAGTRRRGAVAMPIPGTLEALFREVAAGHPVVVLQNLGLSWAPSWHYAVAVGYDLEAGRVLLRSGPMRRQEMLLRTFDLTWERGGRWAFVALPPGRLPETATEDGATRALVAFERVASPEAAAKAYRSALGRWPGSPVLVMGLGNMLYAQGDGPGAEELFREAARTHRLPAAYNNLARVLLERGDRSGARRAAEAGLALAGPGSESLRDTLAAIGPAAAEDTLADPSNLPMSPLPHH